MSVGISACCTAQSPKPEPGQSSIQDRGIAHEMGKELQPYHGTTLQHWAQKLTKVRLCCAQAIGFWGKAFWLGRMHAIWQGSPHPAKQIPWQGAGCPATSFGRAVKWSCCWMLRCPKTPWCIFPWSHGDMGFPQSQHTRSCSFLSNCFFKAKVKREPQLNRKKKKKKKIV